MSSSYDVCICGGGIVGRAMALMLAGERMRVALVDAGLQPGTPTDPDPSARAPDVRAYAINQPSRQLLQSLRCWPEPALATPVLNMQVLGDQGGQLTFAADALGAQALAWIVDVPALEQALAQAIRYQALITVLDKAVDSASLTVVCEGHNSQTRAQWGVPWDVQPYQQHALATRLRTAKPHGQVARQWLTSDQILAFLPLGGADGQEVAVVWSMPSELAPQWQHASPEDFAQALETLSGLRLGHLQVSAPRACWPLQQAQAQRWVGQTPQGQAWALAGDAAHTVHPLAGQGLNLGLADVAELTRVLRERAYWRSIADPKVLRQYERARKSALATMGLALDGMQRVFMHPSGAVQSLRNWGLHRVEQSGPFKTWLARQAMGTATP
jgi:2-polyprenyl-6-methoxyphenol hydroxylase-like FAD-dependent oxidoreductase